MRLVRTVAALRAALGPRRSARSVGLVPTMGALHEGHLSLVRLAGAECDRVVVSVFVNPLQFGAGEDYATYPRDLDRDARLLTPAGVALVFAPDAAEFAPPDLTTSVHVAGLGDRLEGASRPGHFDGVATIVAKLVGAATPDRAYFGEKDYQQLVVVRRMVADLDLPVEVVAGPTVRDPDGLALSSRNAYLSTGQRRDALALSRALRDAAAAWDGDADAPGISLDYAEVCHPETLEPLRGVVTGPARALVAARVGPTRLIDNCALDSAGDFV